MQTPEEHLGALIAAYEDASRGDRALCEPSVRVKVNWGALAVADLIRARDAEVAEQVRAEFENMEHRLSVLLCNLTGGLLSKTGYDVATMEQHIEDYFEREVVEPARAEARAETLAGFTEERRTLSDGYAGWSGDEHAPPPPRRRDTQETRP